DPDTARAYHDEDLDVDTDFCAMCGHDWCSVRISKEIVQFASGKDENYAWDRTKVSAALTAEQREILEKRGVLSPDQIHKLASKTKKAMQGDDQKASCHSDLVDADDAQTLQAASLPIID
ncbi:MAG: thiamine biosynthesis protein ThiC, partial [Planctomycetaceae bacterium]